MNNNIFIELQEKKDTLVRLAEKATEFGWINTERKKEILDNIDNDVLTIGVIGQMKCGKSTFINSFIFGDTVLPSATTPMTAALSIITYGESEKIIADFYNNDEWEELKLTASRSLEEANGDTLEESKIKAAKELVDKSKKLGSSINTYLGTQKEDSTDKLIEYVGADGKYTPLIKSVTMYSKQEYLKGVEIVDTPGFNDPIVSREQMTNNFLKKADVVLLMLYAGRPFDATDREILFKNVGECGVGKVIIAINKYDIPYGNGDSIDDIKEYVKVQIQNASKESGDDSMKDIVNNIEPIPLSAEMALLSQLPMSKITNDEVLKHAWKRSCDNFGISNQIQMRKESRFDNLTSAIKKLIEIEKEEILFKKSLNVIDAAGNNKNADIENNIFTLKGLIDSLSLPNEELGEKRDKLERANKRLHRKIDSLEGDLDEVFRDMIRKGTWDLEDEVTKACNKMKKELDDWRAFSQKKKLEVILDRIERDLITVIFKRTIRNLNLETKRKIKFTVEQFFSDTMDILRRFNPDLDYRDILKRITQQIDLDIENSVFSMSNSGDKKKPFGWLGLAYTVATVGGGAIGAVTFRGVRALTTAFMHNKDKQDFEDAINLLNDDFKPEPYFIGINSNRNIIIDSIKIALLEKLIDPMKKDIDDILAETSSKEAKLTKAREDLEVVMKSQAVINSQINEISALRSML